MSLQSFASKTMLMPFWLRFARNPPWPTYKKLLGLENADRDELKQIQIDRFRSIVEHAEKTVPYYAETFGAAGTGASQITTMQDLLGVPTIDKHQIAANFPDRITSRSIDRATWQYFATSGTTDRLMVIKDSDALSRNMALALYEEHVQGTYAPGTLRVNIPPDACSLACAAASLQPQGPWRRARNIVDDMSARGILNVPRWSVGWLVRSLVSPEREMPSFGPEGTRVPHDLLAWYVERIRNWQPAVLSGLPTYLQFLARHLERQRLAPLPIRSLLPQGALSTPGLKRELARAFGVPVHEVYGGHEFGCIATTCEKQEKLHVLISECLVEIVREGKHVQPGEVGEIVITAFNNRVMPLIRYRPGDVGRLYDDYCACGRKSQLLILEGRLQNTIATSKGLVTEREVVDFLGSWPNVEFSQLVQRSDTRCDLLVVESDSGHPDLGALAEATSDFLGGEMRVRPRVVSTIKPEVSGKFRFVKSTSFERFHGSAQRGNSGNASDQ
jgi:phenylacetate-CoA ligase